MAHFTRELTDAAWYHYRTVDATILRNIDEKTKKAISGSGGTYTPTAAIIIGGDGIELQCKAVVGSGAVAQPGAGKFFIFGDDDYFTHSTPTARIIRQNVLENLSGYASFQGEAQPWMDNVLTVVPSLRFMRQAGFVRIPLRLPDGAILTQVTIGFKVGQSHANVPQHLPRARIVRVLKDGTIEPLPNPTDPSDFNGWHSPDTPASGAAWYNAGALQTLTFDYGGNEKIDTDTYGYALEFKEEHGTNAYTDENGNILVYIEFNVTLADLRPY